MDTKVEGIWEKDLVRCALEKDITLPDDRSALGELYQDLSLLEGSCHTAKQASYSAMETKDSQKMTSLEKEVQELRLKLAELEAAKVEPLDSSSSSDDTTESNKPDPLTTLKGISVERPVLLFPGSCGTEIYVLKMKTVRELKLEVQAKDSAEFLL